MTVISAMVVAFFLVLIWMSNSEPVCFWLLIVAIVYVTNGGEKLTLTTGEQGTTIQTSDYGLPEVIIEPTSERRPSAKAEQH